MRGLFYSGCSSQPGIITVSIPTPGHGISSIVSTSASLQRVRLNRASSTIKMLTNDFLFIALFFVVFVVHGVKRRFMVAPAGQSPLFGCRAYLIFKIAVRLCKGLTSQRVQFFDAGQRVVHIPDQHIEKHLCGLHGAFFQPFYGLAHIVPDGGAVVSHADITHPFHPRKQFGDRGIPGDLPGIKSLIEVYSHP